MFENRAATTAAGVVSVCLITSRALELKCWSVSLSTFLLFGSSLQRFQYEFCLRKLKSPLLHFLTRCKFFAKSALRRPPACVHRSRSISTSKQYPYRYQRSHEYISNLTLQDRVPDKSTIYYTYLSILPSKQSVMV